MGLKKPIFESAKEIGISNIINTLDDQAKKYGKFYEPDPFLISLRN